MKCGICDGEFLIAVPCPRCGVQCCYRDLQYHADLSIPQRNNCVCADDWEPVKYLPVGCGLSERAKHEVIETPGMKIDTNPLKGQHRSLTIRTREPPPLAVGQIWKRGTQLVEIEWISPLGDYLRYVGIAGGIRDCSATVGQFRTMFMCVSSQVPTPNETGE